MEGITTNDWDEFYKKDEPGKTGKPKGKNNFETDDDYNFSKTIGKALNTVDDAISTENFPRGTKIYFAGPWFDYRSKELYHICQTIEKDLVRSDACDFDIYYPMSEINKTPRQAFIKNVRHIENCDVLVALVSKKDVGTAWEIGLAYALKKPIYLLGYDESTFLSHTNVMLAFTGKCMTIKDYAYFLSNNISKVNFVKIKNKWEGIE